MNTSNRRLWARLVVLGLAGGALMFASGANAQQAVSTTSAAPSATDERIAVLEREIAALSAQIADLKASTASNLDDIRATQAANTTTIANGRMTTASGDGAQKFAVRGVVEFDAAHYDERGNPAFVNDLNSGTNFRRARLGVEGTFAKDWNYYLTGEFGGSGAESAQLNQAYIEYTGLKPFGLANPLRVRIGAWPTPTGLEDGINYAEALFLERPAIAELVRNTAGGDGRSSAGVLANGDHWYADAVLTGDTVTTTGEFDEQTGALLRAAFNPIYSPDYNVHVGVNFQTVFDPADKAAGPATTKTIQLQERPELRVDGTRLVNTGAINADGVSAYGAELGAQWKNVLLYGEYFKIDVNRSTVGLFDPSFSGWYVAGSWALTGENHPWVPATGGFRGIRPASTFDPLKGHWGAWELAARYSTLDLNDHEGVSGSAVPAGGIRGGQQDITTLGLNWYPNNVVRFLLDYQWIDVEKFGGSPSAAAGSTAPANKLFNENVDVVSLRSQFSF